MKNLILIPIMVIAMTNVKAAYLPTLKVENDKSFILDLNDWNAQELKVAFISPEGSEIYSELLRPTIRKHRKYNLDLLPQGSYTVLISDELKNVAYTIEVGSDSVISVSEGITTFLPRVNTTDNTLDINLLALKRDVFISLYDEIGNDLYSESIKDTPAINRRLNISQLEPGLYTLNIAAGKNNYYRSFRK